MKVLFFSTIKNTPMKLLSLILFIMISAFSLIYVIHSNRHAYDQLLKAKALKNEINLEWSLLQLEYGNLTALDHVEETARKKLNMFVPSPKNIITIKP